MSSSIHFIHRNASKGRRITIAYRFIESNKIEYGASIFCPNQKNPETFRKNTNRAYAIDRLIRFPIELTIDRSLTRTINQGQPGEKTLPVSVARQIRRALTQRGTHNHSRQFNLWMEKEGFGNDSFHKLFPENVSTGAK